MVSIRKKLNSNKIFFRVDSSIEIGSGHVMRCLTLADELKGHGSEITFITRDHPGSLDDAIDKRGYEVILLSAPDESNPVRPDDVAYANWLGVSWEQDAEETRLVIGSPRPGWLIVDHYGIDASWHKALRDQVGQIMVIDDLADRPLDCDILLDQTYGRQEDDYRQLVPSSCQMLIGSRYALLRPKFWELRPRAIGKRKTNNGINRILVSMGGVDSGNLTTMVLEGLSSMNWQHKPVIDAVLGRNAPHFQQVIAQAESNSLEIMVSADVSDMAERMLAADLAIGAGGTTSWERCCLGLPTITITSTENQQMVCNTLEETGAIMLLDNKLEISVIDIKKNIEMLGNNPIGLQNMSQSGFKIIDGLGVKRTVLEMVPPKSKNGKPVRFRSIKVADTDLLFNWQSDDKTRRYAHNPAKPKFEEHRLWVKDRVEKTDVFTEIIIHDGDPSGVIRLDPVGGGVFMISIYIDPVKYRLGIGSCAISYALRLLPDAEFWAEIHEDNYASKALFACMGFTQVVTGKYVKYAYAKESGV